MHIKLRPPGPHLTGWLAGRHAHELINAGVPANFRSAG